MLGLKRLLFVSTVKFWKVHGKKQEEKSYHFQASPPLIYQNDNRRIELMTQKSTHSLWSCPRILNVPRILKFHEWQPRNLAKQLNNSQCIS